MIFDVLFLINLYDFKSELNCFEFVANECKKYNYIFIVFILISKKIQ